MLSIAETILGDADALADLHDILQFKGRAYDSDNHPLAEKLGQCARALGQASDLIIDDVVHELSKRNMPLSSRLAKRSAPKANPGALLDDAIKLFPAAEAPGDDETLADIPQRLMELKAKLALYLRNKEPNLTQLMAHHQLLLDYLINAAWADE